jgi:hypothetical protein
MPISTENENKSTAGKSFRKAANALGRKGEFSRKRSQPVARIEIRFPFAFFLLPFYVISL